MKKKIIEFFKDYFGQKFLKIPAPKSLRITVMYRSSQNWTTTTSKSLSKGQGHSLLSSGIEPGNHSITGTKLALLPINLWKACTL